MAWTKSRLQLTLYRFLYLIKEMNMNKKLLCAALLGGLGVAQVAFAQDTTTTTTTTTTETAPVAHTGNFDDRWYVTGDIGYNKQDNDRDSENAMFGAIGLGKFINDNWSVDAQVNWQMPKQNANEDLNWAQYGISLDVRRHFMADRAWHPYVLAGVGYQRNEEEFNAFPNPNSPGKVKSGNVAMKLGVGLQGDLGRVGLRAELATRFDRFHDAVDAGGNDLNSSGFSDLLASVGVVIPLGAAPMAPVAPAPVAPNCADMDDDGDGVNNCNDKCPGSQAGQTIGPDGCPVPVSIDLKGVNFDFDKATLRPDAVSILNEAIEILKRYPDLKVEVAGHTDSVGSDAYNQKLSERRAKTVYDYLTSNGVDAGRLVGPTGYGESRPIAPNTNPDGSDNPEGRAQNRRTELNVQNQ
jgi:OOP family OmpA-OmpF porin